MTVNLEKLKTLADGFGVELSDEKLALFENYAGKLVEKNKVMNLTAITDPDGIAVKHFADSLSVFSIINPDNGAKVIDVGTGAGFPSVPMLIARPDLKLTMLDSTAKKRAFIAESLEDMGIDATTLHSRAEEAGQSKSYRESFDFCVSRAVASLNVLAEYCLPFVKVGGTFVAMKGAKAQEEIDAAAAAIKLLGGEITGVKSFSLADDGERNLVFIKKISQTPTKYPRVSAQISKKPL